MSKNCLFDGISNQFVFTWRMKVSCSSKLKPEATIHCTFSDRTSSTVSIFLWWNLKFFPPKWSSLLLIYETRSKLLEGELIKRHQSIFCCFFQLDFSSISLTSKGLIELTWSQELGALILGPSMFGMSKVIKLTYMHVIRSSLYSFNRTMDMCTDQNRLNRQNLT